MMQNSSSALLEEFLDKYVAHAYLVHIDQSDEIFKHYKNIIDCFENSCDEEPILQYFQELAHLKMELDIPYAALANEIAGLKNMLLSKEHSPEQITYLVKVFQKISNSVAEIYLGDYLKRLLHTNNMRISSFSEILELDIVRFYKEHLLWLNKLSEAIQKKDTEHFPQLDPNHCNFGNWLHNRGRSFIQNNSKYTRIETIHKNLHIFAQKIKTILEHKEYFILISYLEKCELLSLSLGTELILIDNIEINKKVTKDALTGALNRHAFRPIFETHYELSYATQNSFVLAMMDLDNFKSINDRYGHIAGDEMLRTFTKCVQDNIRNSDVVVRYGGEEFVLFLPSVSIEKAFEVLERIREDFAKRELDIDGKRLSTSVSIGATLVEPKMPFASSFVDEYVMIADKKLYEAKTSGKNKVVV